MQWARNALGIGIASLELFDSSVCVCVCGVETFRIPGDGQGESLGSSALLSLIRCSKFVTKR